MIDAPDVVSDIATKSDTERSKIVDRAIELGSQFVRPADKDSGDVPSVMELRSHRARALIGWMTPAEARLCLTGRRADLDPSAKELETAEKARKTAAARTTTLDQSDLMAPVPDELADYVQRVRASNPGKALVDQGFEIRMVDLSRTCAVQPQIHTDHAIDRVAGVDPNDLETIAAITLPLGATTALPVFFDPTKNAWLFTSANPNLRVIGNFSSGLQNGMQGWGFAVGVSTSFVQVASYSGRALLRDGYHRAVGLLARGITRVPAFFKEFESVAELNLPLGLFSHEVYMGPHPPLLPDYLDDTVAVDTRSPIVQKVVMIQALEVAVST
jgi:hypothetical protein